VTVEYSQINRPARPAAGANTSSHGVPACSAALIVGDRSMSRPVAKRRFQRSITACVVEKRQCEGLIFDRQAGRTTNQENTRFDEGPINLR
jgi:hypothetical protein